MAVDTKHEGLLVRIPENLLPQGFDAETESFGLSYSGSDLLILKRRRRGEKSSERQVVRLWGDLSSFAFPDILLLLFSNGQTGLVSFELRDAHKTIYVQHGELVFAQSSLKEDRLGESLVRMNKISQGDLDRASRLIAADRKLGKILVDSGAVTAKELFDGVRAQTEEIFYSMFRYREGKFNFFECRIEESDIVILNLATRDLIVEGLQRELGIAGVPTDHIFPMLSGRAINVEHNSEERQVHSLVSAGCHLADIIQRLGIGELQALRLLYRFQRSGLISMTCREPRVVGVLGGGDKLSRTVHDFNSIFMDVFSILQVKVQGVDVLGRLNSFFDNMPVEFAEVFDQARFQIDGSLPTEQVLSNLRLIERDDKVPLALKAFNELLYFCLFEMRNYLSHEDAERLMEIVQNMELF